MKWKSCKKSLRWNETRVMICAFEKRYSISYTQASPHLPWNSPINHWFITRPLPQQSFLHKQISKDASLMRSITLNLRTHKLRKSWSNWGLFSPKLSVTLWRSLDFMVFSVLAVGFNDLFFYFHFKRKTCFISDHYTTCRRLFKKKKMRTGTLILSNECFL